MAYSKRQGLVIASQRIVWQRPAVWVASMVLVVALIGSITALLTRQTTAKIQAYPLVQASVDQSVSRVYRASNTSTPGAPLAATNAVATLLKGENNFRVRIGLTNREQSTVTAGKNNITSISASKFSHTCATTTYYYMYCWGENQYGVIGDGTTQSESKPTKPVQAGALAGKTIKEGYSGGVHSCALASDDNVYCWGWNVSGELGSKNVYIGGQSNVPTAVDRSGVLAGKTVKHLVTGYNHNCVIASDDKLYCWGSNLYGELGNGTTAETATPVFATVSTTGVLANKVIAQVVLGRGFTCVLTTEGRAYCWGRNSIGSLGNGTKVDSLQAVPVAMNGALAGKTITQLTAGDLYVCALASDKKVYCWGANGDGQLGHGDAGRQVSDPVPVSMAHISPAKQFHSISAGGDHTCGITSDKSLYCWGNNSNGQLGNGTTTNANAPVAASLAGVPHGDTIAQVSAGGRHTCVMTEQGRVLCVGNNDNGQLGNGTTTNSSTLTPITPVTHQHIHATIPASTTKLVAQYAKKTPAATCHSIAASQWQDITTTSALAYASTGPAQGVPLAPYGDDPTPPAGSIAYNLQGVVRGITASPHVFSNSDPISVEQTGLWDFALTNKALAPNTHYCLRLAVDATAAPGMSIDTYSAYPEIVTASGTLDIRFTNAAGTTLTNPTTTFSSATTGSTGATTTATLSNASSQQLEVANSASPTGWNVSLAPTGGASAAWTQAGGTARYSYNSVVPSQGRLSIDLSAGTFAASGTTATGQACTTAGLSYSSGGSYIAGTATASAITIASAASSSGLNCTFRLQNIQLRQTIPAYQAPGTYTLPITATVTAQ